MNVVTVTLHPTLDRVIRVAHLIPDHPVIAEVVCSYGSGKGNNTARTLLRLGIPVTATGFQGGKTGEYSRERLEAEGIATSFVHCNNPTRISTIIYDTQSGNHYPIYEPRQAVSGAEADELLELFDTIISNFDLCLLCGAGEGPELNTLYQQMIAIAFRKKIRSFLDSSGESLSNGLKAKPFLTKINLGELSEYANHELLNEEDQIKALKEIIRSGVRLAAVSDQENGLLASNGEQTWRGKLVVKNIINTIGCGDAMLAGMAAAVLQNLSLDEIVRWGVACGTANTQNLGAGFIQTDIFYEYLPRVEIRAV
jgi:1-phosphofructokinase family hexose kinase